MVMALFIIGFRVLFSVFHVAVLILVIAAGALVFFLVLFRLDRTIHDEICELATHLGIPWPSWL